METIDFIKEIRQKIMDDDFGESFSQLHTFLEDSPLLSELLSQTDHHNDILSKINLGEIDFEHNSKIKHQVRTRLLNLINELEIQAVSPEIKKEMQRAVTIANSKNIVVDSKITARDVHIGDKKIYSESKMSKRLRLFLFLFVPSLAIVSAVLYYKINIMSKPLNIKVLVENKTPNINLKKPNGTLTLIYGGELNSKNLVTSEAFFENIPSNFKEEKIQLKYEAEGFISIDTTLEYNESVKLSVYRNNDLGLVQGYVYQDGTEPLQGLENVRVSINCCSALTDASGRFRLEIPFEYQLKKQRLEFFKDGFYQKSSIEPIIKGIDILTYIIKK